MALLSIRGLKKHFDGLIVLDGVDMDIDRGKVYHLIGSNGSGKTTLINIVSGMLQPDDGSVVLDGHNITQFGQLETYRAGLARTFQIPRPFHKLTSAENMSVSVTENPGETFLKASIYRLWRHHEYAVRKKVNSNIKWIGLESRVNEESQNLSGGQQKLLETGRVMMADPKIILLDEPIAGVNPSLAHHIFKKIREVATRQNIAFLIIEHRLDISLEYSDHAFALDGGRVIAQGKSNEILKHPAVVESYLGK
ncbi:MAG: ABC transporter ATP-binding protein [Cenarchaeum symbiont of Oopsacas minuta]|nr:ABC transporter ATP-binding protein [Cenarchaeum symbiont of Oopsacas minuta]